MDCFVESRLNDFTESRLKERDSANFVTSRVKGCCVTRYGVDCDYGYPSINTLSGPAEVLAAFVSSDGSAKLFGHLTVRTEFNHDPNDAAWPTSDPSICEDYRNMTRHEGIYTYSNATIDGSGQNYTYNAFWSDSQVETWTVTLNTEAAVTIEQKIDYYELGNLIVTRTITWTYTEGYNATDSYNDVVNLYFYLTPELTLTSGGGNYSINDAGEVVETDLGELPLYFADIRLGNPYDDEVPDWVSWGYWSASNYQSLLGIIETPPSVPYTRSASEFTCGLEGQIPAAFADGTDLGDSTMNGPIVSEPTTDKKFWKASA